MSEKLLSVVCPCYNEASCINAFVDAVGSAVPKGQPYEIVFVDDGSTDDTLRLIKNRIDLSAGGGGDSISFLL